MSKVFKHKTLGYIAKHRNDLEELWLDVEVWKNATYEIPRDIFFADTNREEVIEKDWITFLFENLDHWHKYEDFRERVLRFIPKQVKFTKKEVWDFFRNNWYNPTIQWNTYWFLEEHNLLSEDTEWETSE